jgi:hypothetical protein
MVSISFSQYMTPNPPWLMDAVLPLPRDFIKPNLGRSEGLSNFLLAEVPRRSVSIPIGGKQQVHGAQGARTEQTEKTEKTG